jgi:hypothetical protein
MTSGLMLTEKIFFKEVNENLEQLENYLAVHTAKSGRARAAEFEEESLCAGRI